MKKSDSAPIIVKLKELPPDGQNFVFTNESGELNQRLKDLIGTNNYRAEFSIFPQGDQSNR